MPIATKVPGLKICELLPSLAGCADKFSLVRTMHHNEPDHGIAGTMGLTGSRSVRVGSATRTWRGLSGPAPARSSAGCTGAGRFDASLRDPGRSPAPGEEAGRRRGGRDARLGL